METIKYIEPSNQQTSNRRLHVHVGSRKFVPPEEIQHLESDIKYTKIALSDGQKIITATTLKALESRLFDFKNFVRVNKSTIVNLDFVENHIENGFILSDNRTLLFSRRKGRAWKERNAV